VEQTNIAARSGPKKREVFGIMGNGNKGQYAKRDLFSAESGSAVRK
jgi:hypothetical protein